MNLGYKWLQNQFLFEKIILCGPPSDLSPEQWKLKGYSLIECYRSNNKTQIQIQFCRHYNAYGYLIKYGDTNDYYINYQSRCIPNEKYWSQRYQYGWNALWGIYMSFNKRTSQTHSLPKYNVSYLDNKVWFAENGLQCARGNLWHCSAQMILLNAFQTYLNDDRDDMKYVMNYGSSQFNKDFTVYPYIDTLFNSYVTQPIAVDQLSKYPEPGRHFKIRELRFHPNPRNTLIWLQDQWKKCQYDQTQRSPLLFEFREKYMRYCEQRRKIISNQWIVDIALSLDNMFRIGMNGTVLKDIRLSHIYDNNRDVFIKERNIITRNIMMDMDLINSLQHMINMNNIKIMFIATRWYYQAINKSMHCSHRCLTNIEQLWQKIVKTFDTNWIILFGNLASLSHKIQYNLIRNMDIMIGLHGAVFSWSLIVNSYKKNQKLFEISIPYAPLHSEHWAKMLDIKGYYQHICDKCCFQRQKDWIYCQQSRVNVTLIVYELNNILYNQNQ